LYRRVAYRVPSVDPRIVRRGNRSREVKARPGRNLRRVGNRNIWLRALKIGCIETLYRGDVIMKSGFAALCAAAICAGVAFSFAPASAQNRLKTCNDEWNAMKANNTVGDKKYADFRKECLAKTAAAPTETPAAAPPAAKPAAPPKSAAATKPAAPAAAGEPVFPTAVSPKYSSETAGKARMHTCLDQYNENKAGSGNGGLNWIQKGGGYYSECNKRLKG
jgi:hypothetical protein